MNLATLRVEGSDDGLAQVVHSLGLEISARWKKGDARLRGNVHMSSGISAIVADSTTPREMADEISRFTKSVRESGISFSRLGLEAELSIGLGVGMEDQFVASVEFSPDELSTFSAIGLILSITAYPCSDEDEANEASDT